MCECGCGEFNPHEVFEINKDLFLVLEIYRGCEYCDTGLMFTLHLMSKSDIDEWMIKPTKKISAGFSEDFPIIGQEDLIKAAKRIEKGDKKLLQNYGLLSNLFQDYGLELLQKGLELRLKEIKKK